MKTLMQRLRSLLPQGRITDFSLEADIPYPSGGLRWISELAQDAPERLSTDLPQRIRQAANSVFDSVLF